MSGTFNAEGIPTPQQARERMVKRANEEADRYDKFYRIIEEERKKPCTCNPKRSDGVCDRCSTIRFTEEIEISSLMRKHG